ncbi:transposase [Mycobacterium sp.]|uniref:transposase n=1 Tax=Mycobacterium sp. TaxID=1785 RepID=UPI0031E45EE1
MAIDWSKRGDYIAKHGTTPEQADEALNDANAVIFDPDYNTKSGRQVRTLGYSPSAQAVLSVITLDKGDVVWGVNAWQSNSRDRRYYRQGGPDE